MFLVRDEERSYLVPTERDPRDDGFRGPVRKVASFEYDENVIEWSSGSSRSEPTMGLNRDNPPAARVFRTPKECRAAGFEIEPGNPHPHVLDSWAEYLEWRGTFSAEPTSGKLSHRVDGRDC